MLTKQRLFRFGYAAAYGIFLAVSTGSLNAQPQISFGGITNAASGSNLSLARGGYFSIYGSRLGTTAGPVSALPLPTTLGGAQVRVKPVGSTTSIDAFLYVVTAGQINAVLPSNVPEGDVDITVTAGTATSQPIRIRVVRSSPGIFTIGSMNRGLGIVQNYESPTSQPLNLFTNPARPGQTLILWATGLGPLASGSDSAAPSAGNIVDNAVVLVAGRSIAPLYAGRAPGIPGVDQVNFTLPSDNSVPDGCYVPVQIKIGTTVSNVGTIAKSSTGNVCNHPFGLSQDSLSKLQFGETLNAGLIQLERVRVIIGTQGDLVLGSLGEKVRASFARFAANGIPESSTSLLSALTLTPGTCVVNTITTLGRPDVSPATDSLLFNAKATKLNAGDTLTLTGNGKTVQMTDSGNAYEGTIAEGVDFPGVSTVASGLGAGTWVLNGTGGRHVGRFSASMDIEDVFKSTQNPASIARGQSFEVRWTGGGGDQEVVTIIGGTLGIVSSGPVNNIVFQCTARASDRRFTVPGSVTGQLDRSATTGFLSLSSVVPNANHFSAPLVAGGTLDGVSGLFVTELNAQVPLQ